MNTEFSKRERERVRLSQILGVLLSAVLVAMFILYFLKLINANMIILATLGFGSALLFSSTHSLSVKYSRVLAGVFKAFGYILILAFLAVLFYMFATGTMTF